MRRSTQVLSVALLVFGPATAEGQDRWRFELRSGDAFAARPLGGIELRRGYGFGFGTEYRVSNHFGFYGGWDRISFEGVEVDAPWEVKVEDAGLALGVRLDQPLKGGKTPSLRLQAGGTYCRLESHDRDEDHPKIPWDKTGYGFGWEAGAGLSFAVGNRFDLAAPAVRFRSLSQDLPKRGPDTEMQLRYLTVELGGSVRF
jgi:hypothetical protein